ncbi:MAG: hypothetical protein KC656_04720 [Myxococcales bacterium]|nr:hypothetical protein [Myxococcales bacterium]
MIWCLAALAGPLPPWVEDGRFEGFVQLDSTELAFPEPEGHPAHTLGQDVLFALREGTDPDPVVAVLREAGAVVEVTGDALTVTHTDPLSLLALELADGTVTDAIERVEEVPHEVVKEDLALENTASARVEVYVLGVHVGRIGPRTTAVIHGVPRGTWEVEMELPNGYRRRVRVTTVPKAEATTRLRMR